MLDVQSIIIYLGLAIILFFLAKYAELRKSSGAVWLIVILLSLISGLRADSVGIDTETYNTIFDLISKGVTKGIYGIEESFIYVCRVLLGIWDNNQFLFLIFALISNGLIIFTIWDNRDNISFRWSVLSYYITFFTFSLNGMRQFLAVSIIVYATLFLKKGKYVKFIIFVLIASLFHRSAIIGVCYLLFEIIFVKYFESKRKLTIYLLVGIGVFFGIVAAYSLVNYYSKYFEQQSSSMGIMMIVKAIMLIWSFGVIETPKNNQERYFCFSNRWYYFVGILLNSLNYIFVYMGRIGLFFYIFESIYIGNIFKAKNKTIWTLMFKFCYVCLLLYYLYDNITRGGQGELPYRFFWQI